MVKNNTGTGKADRRDTINTLKVENKDNESLQKKVGTYETEIQNLKKAAEQTAREYALKEQMTKQEVTDLDYLIYKAGGVEKFTFDISGKNCLELIRTYRRLMRNAERFWLQNFADREQPRSR